MSDVKPYIKDKEKLPELTPRVIGVGILLAILLGSSNAYLGLKVGLTVSATIPASVLSIAIFRALKGSILEVNTAKAIGAAGEAMAAGMVFTIPSLIIIQAWTEIDYVTTTIIALVGGTLGVLFVISLRKVMIEELDLPYPEGVACSEVIIASEKGGSSSKYVFGALGVGMTFKYLGEGLGLWKTNIKSLFLGKFPIGMDISVALFSVGYIVGPSIALMIFIGGAIGWLGYIPALIAFHGLPSGADAFDSLDTLYWRGQTMWIGIGAVIVGGIYTMYGIKDAMKSTVNEVMKKSPREYSMNIPRTQKDLPIKTSYLLSIAMVIPLFIIYYYMSSNLVYSSVSAIIMLAAAFFFTAIAGYLAGVVGSSNNPISSVTMSTLLFASLLLLALGARGTAGMAVTIGIGAVVCGSAAIAGDVMQDLKTGQIIGSTPRNLQLGVWIGAMATALTIAPIMSLLINAYGLGSEELPAPQAQIIGALVHTMFDWNMNVVMFLIGAEIAVFLILINKPVLPIAIGIYLPFLLTIPVLIGGALKYAIDKVGQGKEDALKEIHDRNILISSGLIAGEALMGIVVALLIATGNAPLFNINSSWAGILVFFGIVGYIMYLSVQKLKSHET